LGDQGNAKGQYHRGNSLAASSQPHRNIEGEKVLTPRPLSLDIRNSKHLFLLSDTMPAVHLIRKTRARFTFMFASNRCNFFRAIVKVRSERVMDEVEHRFIAKYFFPKRWGNKKITAELQSTLHSSAISNSTVK
jgi:hypothetical protein